MMKEIAYYKYGQYSSYKLDIEKIDCDYSLGILAEFLMHDLGQAALDFYTQWLEKRKSVRFDGTGFPMYLTLLEDGVVEIGPKVREDDWEPIWDANSKNHFKIRLEKMLDILKQYKEVLAIRPYPNKIVFVQDDAGDVTIKAED